MIDMYNPLNFKHSDCVHYKNGFCDLYKMRIDPNSPICPNFTPKARESDYSNVIRGSNTPLSYTLPSPWDFQALRSWFPLPISLQPLIIPPLLPLYFPYPLPYYIPTPSLFPFFYYPYSMWTILPYTFY